MASRREQIEAKAIKIEGAVAETELKSGKSRLGR